jgi:hypothetical protein
VASLTGLDAVDDDCRIRFNQFDEPIMLVHKLTNSKVSFPFRSNSHRQNASFLSHKKIKNRFI